MTKRAEHVGGASTGGDADQRVRKRGCESSGPQVAFPPRRVESSDCSLESRMCGVSASDDALEQIGID